MSSEEYKKAMSDTIRETKAEISFNLEDVTANSDCILNFPTQAVFSNGNQILNGNTKKSTKIATLEKGFWKLDGTYMNLGYKDISNEEIGFISDLISDEDGFFENPPVIIFNFSTTHSSIGLTLFFDNLTGNYIKKMRIIFYQDNNVLNDEIVENTDAKFILSKRIENYDKIEIQFLKTSLPYRRVRLVDIIFGIVQTYEDKEIVNCNLTREFNPFNDNIPSHEVSVEIDNLAKEFNLINPSGVYNYLQKRQQVSVKFGVVLANGNIEFVEMGKYYLNDWSTKDLIATLKAKDILSFLEEIYYTNSTVQMQSLNDFAIEILTFAGISEYILDDSLKSINATTDIDNISVKELLKQIAIASNCVIFVDKGNRINIVKLTSITDENDITLSNMYNVPEISLDEVVSSVKVVYSNNNELTVYNSEVDGKEKSVNSIFISTQAQAQVVGEYLLNLYQNRLKYKVDWRQNMIIDINEKNKIEDNFNENKNVIITKQEFKYAGYMSGKTEGRGAE